jgi:hypothetical protein
MAQPQQQGQLNVLPTTFDEALSAITPNKPVYMINLMRYRPTAMYSPSDPPSFQALPPVTGREAFQARYGPAFREIAKGADAEVVLWGKALALLTKVEGEGEKWDDVAVIKYGYLKEFRRFVESDEYRVNALPHRLAALEDRKLIAVEAYE